MRGVEDETFLSVCDVEIKDSWHDVSIDAAIKQKLEASKNGSLEDSFVEEVFLSWNFSKKAIGKELSIATRSNVFIDNMNDFRDEFYSYAKSQLEAALKQAI